MYHICLRKQRLVFILVEGGGGVPKLQCMIVFSITEPHSPYLCFRGFHIHRDRGVVGLGAYNSLHRASLIDKSVIDQLIHASCILLLITVRYINVGSCALQFMYDM